MKPSCSGNSQTLAALLATSAIIAAKSSACGPPVIDISLATLGAAHVDAIIERRQQQTTSAFVQTARQT
jgi:hypothetical protein